VNEIRRNLITGEPILFAPERAARPNAFDGQTGMSGPHSVGQTFLSAECPFCAGNESMTPPEIARVGDPWRVRVFPNKYPALRHHEVIVESPSHEARFESIDAEEVVGVYLVRYRVLANRKGVRAVTLFKNHGRTAGASIAHLHSQIAAMPFVPPRITSEELGFAKAISCPLCDAITTHRVAALIIDETPTMVRLAPHGSKFAHQQWIIPKRHTTDVASLTDGEERDLAALLQRAAAGMQKISPAHNWMFLGFPGAASAHCYVDVFPRVTNVAGFELGTGTFIDVVDPAASAHILSER